MSELRYVIAYQNGVIVRDLGYDESYKMFLDAFDTKNKCSITRDLTDLQKNQSN